MIAARESISQHETVWNRCRNALPNALEKRACRSEPGAPRHDVDPISGLELALVARKDHQGVDAHEGGERARPLAVVEGHLELFSRPLDPAS